MPRVSATATVQLTDVQHAGSVFDVDVLPESLVQRAIDSPFHQANTASAANATAASDSPAQVAREPNGGRLAQVVSLPPPYRHRAPAATLHPVQEWEGYVVEINDTHFTARLVDLSAGLVHEEEEAIIPLTELSDNDVGRMRDGSIFRWVIGYERSASGTKKRVSQIVFRDLPAMTPSDLRDGRTWARDTVRALRL